MSNEPEVPTTDETQPEAAPDIFELLGLKSVLTGTLTVDRSNEETSEDGESADLPTAG